LAVGGWRLAVDGWRLSGGRHPVRRFLGFLGEIRSFLLHPRNSSAERRTVAASKADRWVRSDARSSDERTSCHSERSRGAWGSGGGTRRVRRAMPEVNPACPAHPGPSTDASNEPFCHANRFNDLQASLSATYSSAFPRVHHIFTGAPRRSLASNEPFYDANGINDLQSSLSAIHSTPVSGVHLTFTGAPRRSLARDDRLCGRRVSVSATRERRAQPSLRAESKRASRDT
jgi:hypothetical protein